MQGVFIGLQFSALIPIVVTLAYRPRLNLFFKLLLASVFLSIVFDIIGTSLYFMKESNFAVYCLYCILNSILIVFIWQKVPFYSTGIKARIRLLGYVFVAAMVVANIYFKFTKDALYIISSLNVFLGLIYALQYYYQKVTFSTQTPLLSDPYFITATAFILFNLSTITILAAQLLFENDPLFSYTWLLRQIFYLIYNIIIGYAFYVIYKTQQLKT